MINERLLEEAANELEMLGGPQFSPAADFLRRIELERADASRKTIEAAIERIEGLDGSYKNDIYRKAWKVAVRTLRAMKVGER
jgi:hypothetical protein